MRNNKISAVVLAAGQGKRMNTSVAKQFLDLKGKPIIYYSLKAFQETNSIDEIILVTSKDQLEYCKINIVKKYQFNKVKAIIEGGKERYNSVYNALSKIKASEYVLIHDGARPFISVIQIEQIIQQVKLHNACIIGTPVKETIKVVDDNKVIIDTPNRNSLWAAQTPQAFRFDLLRSAYEAFYLDKDNQNLAITDDAMVYEHYIQEPVKMIPGDYNNLKITTPEDLLIAHAILEGILYDNE